MDAAVKEKPEFSKRPDAQRFTERDLPECGNWLMGRLRDKWPAKSDAWYLGQIRAWASDKTLYFVRCGNTVGLFYTVIEPADPRPMVREQFVWKMTPHEKNDPECRAIYGAAKAWARTRNAKEITVGCHSDYPYGVVRDVIAGKQSPDSYCPLV